MSQQNQPSVSPPASPLSGDEATLLLILSRARRYGATDVLLKVGHPPAFRVGGILRYLQTDSLTPAHTGAFTELLLRHAEYQGELEALHEHDCAYGHPEVGRFRVGIYRQRRSFAIAFRVVPFTVPSFDDLGVPPVVRSAAELERGLVLVVGAAGQGKSTTLAAIIDQINRTRRVHVVTIEDPIEYVHEDRLAAISQREIGPDTQGFARALRSTLRHAPDVIMVGEVRDEETMDIALKASETGHLVLATLHTADVERTVGRVLSLVPGDAADARTRLADNLRAVFAQRLLRKAGGQGRVLAVEALVATGTARETLKQPKGNPPLKEVMERGEHPYGMATFEMALERLEREGLIERADPSAGLRG